MLFRSLVPLNPDLSVLVVGFQSKVVKESFSDRGLIFVEQKEQLGTGHAAQQAKLALHDFSGDVLVVCGDMPLIKSQTLIDLVEKHREKKSVCTVLTLKSPEKKDFGLVIRDEKGLLSKIVEHKDASEEQKKVDEFNSGVYCFDKYLFLKALDWIGDNNIQKEYYLTADNIIFDAVFCGDLVRQVDTAEIVSNVYQDKKLKFPSKTASHQL